MFRLLIILCTCLTTAACGAGGPALSQVKGSNDSALEVHLEGVSVRQYRQKTLRFQFRADRMRLNESKGLLSASGRIAAELAPVLWHEAER